MIFNVEDSLGSAFRSKFAYIELNVTMDNDENSIENKRPWF